MVITKVAVWVALMASGSVAVMVVWWDVSMADDLAGKMDV